MASQSVPTVNSDKKVSDSGIKSAPVLGSSSGNKEREVVPGVAGDFVESRDSNDEKVLEQVKKDVDEARLSQPNPELGGDIAAAGVYSPSVEAEKTAKAGGTIELDVTEEALKRGTKEKVHTNKSWDTMVYSGTKSIIGLAIWAGRLIKMAHMHAKRIVFRKSGPMPSAKGGAA